jgi:hypothetical protein
MMMMTLLTLLTMAVGVVGIDPGSEVVVEREGEQGSSA